MLVLKDVLKVWLKPNSSGGKEFQSDKYLTDRTVYYPGYEFNIIS